MLALKGRGHGMAEDLRTKSLQNYDNRQARMKEEAEARRVNAEKIKQEDLDNKQRVKDKKAEIRKIIDGDIENKRNFKRNTAMHVKKSDFDDNNLFTNVYSTKEHRAFEMDKKKEHVIGLMKNHF